METVEELNKFIRNLLDDPELNLLRLTGIAWSNWRLSDGSLQDGHPNFRLTIESDLELYGYSLIRAGLSLLEQNGHSINTRKAFEYAATTFESLILNIENNDIENNFRRIMSATCYHLAGYSASAYSIFSQKNNEHLLSISEKAIQLLVLRNLNELREVVKERLTNENYTDKYLVKQYRSESQDFKIDEMIAEILNTKICRALAYFDFALQTGETILFENARSILQNTVNISEKVCNVPLWWICSLCLYLIDDLWASSLHKILPLNPAQGDSPNFEINRNLFIGILYNRDRSEIEAWPSQVEAIKSATNSNENLVLTLPTSAGKTRIAEIATLTTLSNFGKVLIVTPLRALSAQTEKSFKKIFEPLGFDVSALYGGQSRSEVDNQSLDSNDILIATPEKLDFALREDSTLLNEFKLIVFDEGHMIGPTEREVRFESLINRLLKRQDATDRRIICLSAVLPSGEELEDYSNWVCMSNSSSPIHQEWRPTRQRFGNLIWNQISARLSIDIEGQELFFQNFISKVKPRNKHRSERPTTRNELVFFTAWKFANAGKSTLIYCPRRSGVEKLGSDVIDLCNHGYLNPLPVDNPLEYDKLKKALKVGREWLDNCHPSIKCLELGIGLHHGRLPDPFRRELETVISEVGLKVIISSPTLAQGLNLNSSVLLITELKRRGKLISIDEFANVTGRAGRAYTDVEGQNICVIFEKNKKGKFDQNKGIQKLEDWNYLVKRSRTKSIESGLIQIVKKIYTLISQDSRFNQLDGEELWEYLVESSQIWDNLSHSTMASNLQSSKFNNSTRIDSDEFSSDKLLERLDISIFSMNETLDVELIELNNSLDEALRGTLWSHQISKIDENLQLIFIYILYGRAHFIWNNSTKYSRRGYFKLGVGFSTGIEIEKQFDELCTLIDQANSAAVLNNTDILVESLTNLASRLFKLSPFKPDKEKPTNWESILEKWILGTSIAGFEPEELQFIEEALVYKLVWAIEAIRLKKIDHEKMSGTTADGGGGEAAASLETGVPNYSMSMLIRSGFSSRIGAKIAIEQTGAKFMTFNKMKEWLFSGVVESLSENVEWPTPESAELWSTFRNNFLNSDRKKWTIEEDELTLNIPDNLNNLKSGFYRIESVDNSSTEISLVTPDFTEIATVSQPFDSYMGELVWGQFMETSNNLKITRFGTREYDRSPI